MAESGAIKRLDEDAPDWARFTLYAIGAALVLRWGLLALQLSPLHFDEAQYWSYGEAFDLGYYSKPPMTAWLIRLSTEIFGDTVFGVRFFAPVTHAWIAWLLFATGRRMFDARTGFWAAALYLTLPGVTVSSMLMSTDPPMMCGWAAALYAVVRALQAEEAAEFGAPDDNPLFWWALTGVAIGAGLLSKYTMIAFVGGGIGYALFSRQGAAGARRAIDWTGPGAALVAALIVFSPNLWWNWAHDFASFSHVGDNAKLSGGAQFRFDKAAEFFGAQAMIFGPVAFVALGWMLTSDRWRDEWGYRLLLWLTVPLIVAMTAQAFLSRAHPNWAAPAYVAGSLAVTAWLLDFERRVWMRSAVAVALGIGIGFVGLAGVYRDHHAQLPRTPDPFKKMRPNPEICARAMALRGDLMVLSGDRRLLADCMFAGGLGLDQIRILNAKAGAGNHYELTSSLQPDERGAFLVVLRATQAQAQSVLAKFDAAEVLEAERVRTHANRETAYVIARVEGFRGY